MSVNETIPGALTEYVTGEVRPDSILLLGPSARASWERLGADQASGAVFMENLSDGFADVGRRRFDLVYVAGLLEHLDRPSGDHLLSSLRDHLAGILLIRIDRGAVTAATWSFAEMLSFGFERLDLPATFPEAGEFYRFSLFDYKQTPDWLNSQFWARPEMWKP